MGPILLFTTRGLSEAADYETLTKCQQEMGGKHFVYGIIQKIPSFRLTPDVRAAAKQTHAQGKDLIRAAAYVIEERGFFAASMIAIITTIGLFSARRIFGDEEEALAWLLPQVQKVDLSCNGRAVAEALSTLRSASS